MIKPKDIPSAQERLLLCEVTAAFARVVIGTYFDRRIASYSDAMHVARAVWIGQLRGRPVNAQQIARSIGMPRTTVLRKLDYLVGKGHLCRDGTRYYVADKIILKTPLRDKLIHMVYATADKLKHMEQPHVSGRDTSARKADFSAREIASAPSAPAHRRRK
jgi:hypothetical protein